MPHHTYRQDLMGSASVEPSGSFEAGTWHSFTVTYTCGKFGIDDRGNIKMCFRGHADQTKLQFDDPKAPGYTTVEASTGIPIELAFEHRRNTRPWNYSLLIRCNRYLTEGDTLTICIGDPSQGSPGIRLQTMVEPTFEFQIIADPFACYDFIPLLPENQATINVVSGPAVSWKAILPTLRRAGEPFRLCLKYEDVWGNPSDQGTETVKLEAVGPLKGLPETIAISKGEFTVIIDDLVVEEETDVYVNILSQDGSLLTRSNPLRSKANTSVSHYWSDLHGQSEESIGTNSCREYFEFGRDKAFLDICAHQANDFQISDEFWAEINSLTKEFNDPGTFVTLPGYEWSGNTSLGGDHNVWYRDEGRPIYRSCRALVYDTTHPENDAHSANDLFVKLKDEDALVTAHIGGRYADVKYAHNAKIEPSVEIHSAWGSFEWIVHDAFDANYRVGIVASSEGHKGRPGASYPGDASFGSYGGLTCHLLETFDRDGLFEGFRRRHHYATTGARMYLSAGAEFDSEATVFLRNPELGDVESEPTTSAIMGDIVQTNEDEVTYTIDVVGSAPLERIDLRDGHDTFETIRAYDEASLGNRIRIVCEGANYRGRGRNVNWDCTATFDTAKVKRVKGYNFWNAEKQAGQTSDNIVQWQCVTTGGYSAVDIWLEDGAAGTLKINSNIVDAEIPLADIGLEDITYDCGGLFKALRVFRLPDENTTYDMKLQRKVKLREDGDTRLYCRVTQEDGHQGWSSPIYLFKK